MADNTLIKMKTGTIAKLEQGISQVPLDKGSVYFAVDTTNHKGKIVYDAPNGNSVDRIVMSTQAEYADYAGEAAKTTGITGIYPVKGTQTAKTNAWTGTIYGISELFDGLTIAYYLPYAGTSSSATLNLTFEDNSSTGAIPIYYTDKTRMTSHYGAGSTIILTYWSAGSISVAGTATAEGRWLRCDYNNTNIYQLRHNSGAYTTTTATGGYMLFLSHPTSGTSLIPVTAVNNSTATTKALTTAKFNPFGSILYYSYSSTTAIAANAELSASSLYEQIAFDLRYSFNTGTTLTTSKDVYIKAIPQTDGTAILDTETPITQILPTSADDRIYIYLGHAYSTSNIELHPIHPIYYYKNGKIALYTGEPLATTTSSGLMSSADKIKLDSVAAGAQVNTITGVKGDAETTYRTGNVNITKANIGLSNVENKSSATIRGELTSSNVTTALGYTPATQNIATTSANGLMSEADKRKLDGIAENAKNTTISATAPINASASTGAVSLTHSAVGPSSTANTSKGDTSNQTPGFGGTFKVTSETVDKYGHTTALAEHTVTIPSATATTSVNGLMSSTDKERLDGISAGAEVNQNAFAKVKVGTTTIEADAKQDTLELAGSNVTLTPDATNDKVTIGITKSNVTTALGYTPPTTNTTYENATTSTAGLMSAEDKVKLDGIATGAQVNSVTGVKGNSESTYRTGNVNITKANIGLGNVENKSSATIRGEITSSNVTTALGYTPATQDVVTTSVNGLMSATDKVKLDGITAGATNTTITATAPIAASASTGAVTLTHATSGPSTTADTSKGDTSNQTPTWGATFKVTSGTVDKFGHTKTFADHTVKIPNAVATTSADGLMSSADKQKIDGGLTIAGNTVAIGGSITADTLRSSLGLSNAMHFIGIATVAITDGSTTNPTITGYDFGTNGVNAKTGDVVIDKDSAYEFVWTGVKWERLGPDGSYALSGHTHDVATTSANGFMSSTDKSKLDGIANNAKNTTISATSPIVASAETGAVALTHANSGVTANTYGVTATTALTPGFGSTFSVPGFTVNATGHITAAGAHTVKIPATTATTTAVGLMSTDDKIKLDGISANAKNTTITATAPIVASASTGEVTLTHSTSGPSTTADTSKGDTSNQTPTWGGTFKVTSGTVDKYGHTKTFADHTVTIPSAVATTEVAGLMSSSDKQKLDGVATGATANTGTVTKVTAGTGLNTSADQADSATKGSITTTGTLYLTKSGVTAGSYGPSANATPAYNATFNVPYITVDTYGRVTAASTKTVKIPATDNTDIKQNITLATTLKAYVTGVTTVPTATAQALTGVGDTGVYLTTTAGELNATQYKINEKAYMHYITETDSIGFTFV